MKSIERPWSGTMLDIEEGTDVRVYWNLHKECYSVQTKQWPKANWGWGLTVDQSKPKRWYVFGHCDQIALDNPTFKVSKKGNQRVRDTGTKNVHAYIRGYWTTGWNPYPMDWVPVHYNPYRDTDFMLGQFGANRVPIHQARHAILTDWGKMWASA